MTTPTRPTPTSALNDSEVITPSSATVPTDRKVVLVGANGVPLVRLIGFKP